MHVFGGVVTGIAAVQMFKPSPSSLPIVSRSASHHLYHADPEQDDRTRPPKRQGCVSQSWIRGSYITHTSVKTRYNAILPCWGTHSGPIIVRNIM